MSRSFFASYAAHVLVRFHGNVAEDRVLHAGHPIDLRGLGLRLPRLGWQDSRHLRLDDHTVLGPGQHAQVDLGQGLLVEIRIVPQYPLPRTGRGDLFMVGTFAAMVLLALAFEGVLNLWGEGGQVALSEPTPELIARLLEEDFEGVEDGYLPEARERPVSEFQINSFYLPAGDVGDSEDLGGAEVVAERIEHAHAPAQHLSQPLPPAPTVADLGVLDEAAPAPELPDVSQPQSFGHELDGLAQDHREQEQRLAADKEGWGYKDHDGAMEAHKEAIRIRSEIRLAQAQLKIDPDDAWALQHLAYYQYLAEDYDEAERTHERFVELYPDSPAGYNNLALVYKRRGDYQREEGYYRLALELSPEDAHALNNLAVNLAHQERYDEALAIMDRVGRIEPGEPYADLHRAKILAAMGRHDLALKHLELALAGVAELDTLHTIEFRQDIRVDPAFDPLREEPAFEAILVRYYGEQGRTMKGGASG